MRNKASSDGAELGGNFLGNLGRPNHALVVNLELNVKKDSEKLLAHSGPYLKRFHL